MRASPLCLAAVLFLASWGGRSAHAQSPEERAAARSAAQQGIAAWKEGRHAAAIDLLTRAETVVHAPPHLLYIARAHRDAGHLVKARETYLKLSKEELASGAPKAFVDAKAEGTKELAQLEPRLAYVKITLVGSSPPNLRFMVDDVAVATSLLEVEAPTDPGAHKFQVLGDGVESEVASLNFEEGARRTITLTLHAAAGAAPTAVPSGARATEPAPADRAGAPPARETTPPSDARSSEPGHGLRVLSYVMFGAGAVAIGTGAYFQNVRMRREKVSTGTFEDCNPRYCTDDEVNSILTLDARANAAQRSANIAFALGGVAAALGVTLFVMDAHQSSRSVASGSGKVAVHPWISTNAAGVDGTF
jgi:hypothetical protein